MTERIFRQARTLYRSGAVIMTAIALIPGYYAVTLPWIPAAGFDVLGILFVIQNLPHIMAWVLALGFLFGALYLGIRGWFR